MRKKIIVAVVVGIALGAFAAVCTSPYWFHYLPRGYSQPHIISLTEPQAEKILLYAELENGFLIGKFFNQNPEMIVSQITVAVKPKDEKNPFNQFTPRFFNVDAIAKPRAMSSDFKIETGALNPEFHSLTISGARGFYE
ncbi:MAG: hypothetical protein KKC76_12410 [Proteobacteria bacterium]|nr:hypothetical protein [Pseudomonadota bacterium]MBU4295343.1 hypothetical protein [Pseudomonadota bacterium]MCG2748199.1 hypothetical protein [Desulfobulbaceae bacterium]